MREAKGGSEVHERIRERVRGGMRGFKGHIISKGKKVNSGTSREGSTTCRGRAIPGWQGRAARNMGRAKESGKILRP